MSAARNCSRSCENGCSSLPPLQAVIGGLCMAFIIPLSLKRSFENNFQCSVMKLLFADEGICGDGNVLDERRILM